MPRASCLVPRASCLPLASCLLQVSVLLFSTGVAMVLRNLGFLAAFAGAVLGSCIIYIFPALMHISATQKAVEADLKVPALHTSNVLSLIHI